MSCYNSERGTIKIPSTEMVELRKSIVKGYNQRQKELRTKFNRNLDSMRKMLKDGHSQYEIADRFSFDRAMSSMFRRKYDSKTGYLKKCYKKDLDLKKISAQKVTLRSGGLYVTLDTKNRRLVWNVEENNRAVEDANDSDLGRDTMRALNRVEWCRNSGGVIKYQDEYQRDAYQGPSVSQRFGPNGKRQF